MANAFGFSVQEYGFMWGRNPITPDARPRQLSYGELEEVVFSGVVDTGMRLFFQRSGGIFVLDKTRFPTHQDSATHDLDRLVLERSEQIRLLNALSLIVYSELSRIGYPLGSGPSTISGNDVSIVNLDSEGSVCGVAGRAAVNFIRNKVDELRAPDEDGVSQDVMEQVCRAARNVVQRADSSECIALLALMNEAVGAFKGLNFALATTASWSVCERIQGREWRHYYENSTTYKDGPPSRRQRDYLEGRDFSASVIATVLELAGIYSAEFKTLLDKSRRQRNSWLHAGVIPHADDAAACIEAAIQSFEREFSLEIHIPLSYGLQH